MPRGAHAIRAEQLSLMSGLEHKKKTSKAFEKALSALIDLESGNILLEELSEEQKAAARVWRRDYLKDTALPTSFIQKMSKLTSQALEVWRTAREKSDFKSFLPTLEKVVAMKRKQADYLGFDDHPYDALLDEYEPGMTTQEVSEVLHGLVPKLRALLERILCQPQINTEPLSQEFDEERQLAFSKEMLSGLGFSWEHERLDLSTHPFSETVHPTDRRITTRLEKSDFVSNLRTTLHEAGHSLYDQGLPIEHFGTPLAEPISLGIHESQSRFWETRIGLSPSFWKHWLPKLKNAYGPKTESITEDAFYRMINRVEPSFIRVESDEVTYNLHVILRFEIEKALIEGSLKPSEVPEFWNSKMQQLVGITPPNDRLGCLQDIHWAFGLMGYFPTYTLGNLFAAQFFETFASAHPNWEERVASGELAFILEWLRENVHRHGRRYLGKELVEKVTGQKLSPEPFLRYLDDKYSKIYAMEGIAPK